MPHLVMYYPDTSETSELYVCHDSVWIQNSTYQGEMFLGRDMQKAQIQSLAYMVKWN